MKTIDGLLIKALGGFYYVEAENNIIYECKARGSFRRQKLSPYVGDRVTISIPDDGYCAIESIAERKNSLIRPPLANIDTLFIVASTTEPEPNMLVIDKMTAAAVSKEIEPVIVISKTDLSGAEKLKEIYAKTGFKLIECSKENNDGAEEIKSMLGGKISAFTGNSGVGKSTILNAILPELELETGDISRKLGRGRHTTRHTELYKICGGYIADTPGFSTVDIERYELIRKEDLPNCFPEFEPYICNCKFTSCAHIKEKGCGVLEALNKGKISQSRHNSYVMMYDEVKDIKDWMNKS